VRLQSLVEAQLVNEKIMDWLLANSSIELVPEGSLSTEEETDSEAEPATEAETTSPE
ncbi:MAG: trigger factor, partial [Sphaerospermopsis kisseleviana]